MSLVAVVNCWSSLNKGDKSYITHKLNNSPDFKYYKQAARPFKTCKDENELCNLASGKEYTRLCGNDKFASVCKRTCGRCPAVSALSCHASAEGCCWDNITKVSSGCPECVDRAKACKKAYNACHLSHIKRACPETCRVCSDSKCYDDEHQKEFCSYWKEGGFCESERDLMVEYCAKTCGLCDLNNPVKMAATASNTVIEVFRKGSESLINLSADEKLASEKQLIKILLEEKKKRETNTEKKKAIGSDNEIVATVINDNKKKEKMIEKAASETKKSADEKLSKKTEELNNNVLSDESFEALVKLINNEDKKAEAKKQEDDDKAFKAFIKELQADEKKSAVAKKETEEEIQTEQSKKSNNALMEILLKKELVAEKSKKEASPMLTKKSVDDGRTKNDVLGVNKTKKVASKKETKLLDDISTQYLMNLMLKDEEEKKRQAKLSPEEAVHQALFDLLKERIEAQEKKKKEI